MIVGFPYTFVVLRDNVSNFNAEDKKFAESEKGKGPIELGKKVPGTERAWRMAHMEALTNGFLALLIGALVPSLKLEEKELARLANATAVCVAGNVIGSTVAAAGETRGLMSGGSKMGIVAYWNFMVGLGRQEEEDRRYRENGSFTHVSCWIRIRPLSLLLLWLSTTSPRASPRSKRALARPHSPFTTLAHWTFFSNTLEFRISYLIRRTAHVILLEDHLQVQ